MKQCQWCSDNLFDNDTPGLPTGVPQEDCCLTHWKQYTQFLKGERDLAIARLEMHDDDRDKLDVAEWLQHHRKVREYTCQSCQREYQIPAHLVHITCICGHRCRLRHLGGTDPSEAVIDAAMAYFGNERQAQLAYVAECIVSPWRVNYTAEEIRKMIQQEMDRWVLEDDGWRRK
jgi:hypothetical protein